MRFICDKVTMPQQIKIYKMVFKLFNQQILAKDKRFLDSRIKKYNSKYSDTSPAVHTYF